MQPSSFLVNTAREVTNTAALCTLLQSQSKNRREVYSY